MASTMSMLVNVVSKMKLRRQMTSLSTRLNVTTPSSFGAKRRWKVGSFDCNGPEKRSSFV